METDLAWAAGLFEGEGCVTKSGNRLRVQLRMTHEQSVRRIRQVVGLGRVYGPYGPYKGQLGRQPFFMWVVHNEWERDEAIKKLWPYLTEWVQQRIQEQLDEYYGK